MPTVQPRLLLPVLAALACGALAVPGSAHAVETSTWDFQDGQLPGPTDVGGLDSVTPEALGLRIRTSQPGRIIRPMDTGHPVQAVTLYWKSAAPVEAVMLWHPRNLPGDTLVQLPISIPAGESAQNINLIDYDAWDTESDRIGLAFPAGTDLYLQGWQFHRWNAWEQMREMWKSFWMFDSMQAYSINFLWGPVLTRTPFGTQQLWLVDPPPRGWSLNRVLLPALAVLGLLILLHWLLRPGSRSRRIGGVQAHAAAFALVVAAAWIGFDLRMGAEILGYAKHDYDTYLSKPPGQRTFRAALDFDDVARQSLPELRKEERFGFLPPPGTPFAARIRTLAYPSQPASPTDDLAGVDTWLVYLRPDIVTGSGGRLMIDGQPLTPPGTVIKRFSTGSFLFRAAP